MSLTVSDSYINKNLSASLIVFASNSIKSTSPGQGKPATLDYKQIVVIMEKSYRELPYHHLVISAKGSSDFLQVSWGTVEQRRTQVTNVRSGKVWT